MPQPPLQDCRPGHPADIRRLFISLLLLLVCHPAVRGAEPWADAKLPATADLLVWLDASKQPEARKAAELPALKNEDQVAVWLDGSGNRLHFVQRQTPAQPRFLQTGSRATVRFDGKGHFLEQTGVRRRVDSFTLFLVAAPHANPGFFRGLMAGNQMGKNDYTTGFTVDLSGFASTRFDHLNVEGKGFVGAGNLLDRGQPFGRFHTVEVVCQPGAKGVELYLDGKAALTRRRQPGAMQIDELALGARFYSNEAIPPFIQGFFAGDIAEVLLYSRVLTTAERALTREYLGRKHAGLDEAFARPTGAPARVVANPPAVQMLVPGFRVQELPVDLPNINNVKYRADGKLVALAYNGDVYVLSDTDGDGLEDRADLFWNNKGRLRGPIGMALTPPGYRHGQGVFVAGKGKVSLLLAAKGSDVADREVVVASGWKELPHGVDALGVALSKEGKVYFGLGTADFTNAYLLQDGKTRYDLRSERGTILEVSEDFKTRTIHSTGIRFPVGMAFNARGDLFATDQEGATWLPNGNPFDELLHIQPGRHYGFPPRHPRHLPGVIDEPSVFDYGPQHQSTCGLNFNEPLAPGGKVFGPDHWRGDALVSGYSRGKLYRTQLVHTPEGYVARNHLLACLNMLAVDACVSPRGDLIVAVHSGQPDWGSGPGGKGKLYRISYADPSLAQPAAIWAVSPREVRISFDRPVKPEHVRDLARRAFLEWGDYVRAGDRFEVLRPGYAVVQQQMTAPRQRLAVYAVNLLDDGHTLSFETAPHPRLAWYALTLPGLGRPDKPGTKELPQHAEADLDYELTGVEALWKPAEGASWSGWLPHPDLTVSRGLLAGSGAHRPLWTSLEGKGQLTLRTKLDLWQMLRPAVQPGSTLDHTWPAEKVTLVLSGGSPFTARMGDGKTVRSEPGKDGQTLKLSLTGTEDLVPLEVVLDRDRKEATFRIAYFTSEDARPRALPLRRFVLPWAERKPAPAVVQRTFPELEGGNWLRGRKVFYSEEGTCGKCHAVRGIGSRIGPDLSNLIHRDLASVLRDIRDPSAALNPDHLAYSVEMNDGRVFVGVPRDGGNGKLIIGEASGKETAVARSRIESFTPLKTSLMPEGLDRQLGKEKMRDLLTFLLTEPLQAAPVEAANPPAPRTRAEIEAVWKSVELPAKVGRPLSIVLASGPKDHGPGEHDYPLWQRRWYNLLSLADGVKVELANGWPAAVQMRTADVIVFYSNNPGWTADKAKELDAFLARGGGLVYLHYAVDGHRAVEPLAERIGLAWRGGWSRFRHGALELDFTAARSPIARGLGKVRFVDESYWRLVGDSKGVDLLATGEEEGKPQPLIWSRQQGKGRVFVSILGHYNWTFDDPVFRLILLRGLCWTAGEPVDRLSELITIGARVSE